MKNQTSDHNVSKPETDSESSVEKLFNKNVHKSKLIKLAIIAVIAISMSIFHMYTSGFGVFEAWKQRSLTLSFILLLIPLLFPSKFEKRLLNIIIDLAFFILAALVVVYSLQVYPDILFRETDPNQTDVIVGVIAVLLVLEGTRRAVGYFLSALILFFVLYAYFGNYMPGMLVHPGFSVERIVATFYNSTSGMFGIVLGAMSNYIIIFIIFGAFLLKSKAGQLFIDLAYSLTGSRSGGPAKVSVFASGLMAMTQGAAVSNVATTGTLTIPLMKRVGYKPHFAGGVESAASVGGQLMPPIMGASAFIIASNLKIPYIHLALFALIPAILHYLAVYFMVHFQAKKNNLKGLPKNELPNFKNVLKEGWLLFLPIIMIIVLLVMGYSPQFAGFYSILGIVALSAIRKSTRMSLKDILAALEIGGKNAVSIGIICAAAGLLIGSVNLTGLGLKFSSLVLSITGESVLISLILIMLASILLGMGMPTVSAYVILAVLGVPALVSLGINEVAAHLFVLYFAIMSNVTPPVAVAAYTAAAIANTQPNKTGFSALKICLGTFIIPYMFVFGPTLLLQGSIGETTIAVITAVSGILALTTSLIGWMFTDMKLFERILGFASALFLMYSGLITDGVGIMLLFLLLVIQYTRNKRAVYGHLQDSLGS
ncbi:TRAP transporter fused permease subunit [Lentibacillus halophilus]|uniref:TRAP transporter fused permease subunit n=1 Tax=Lentibacillus halophilus TaxID=295065 RepID=A0ABP3IUQ0_9BACI